MVVAAVATTAASSVATTADVSGLSFYSCSAAAEITTTAAM